MTSRTKRIILLVAGVQIVLIAGLLALPTAVQAIPGRYRVALSERSPFLGNVAENIIQQVAPVPTALPAPRQETSVPQVDISGVLALASTAVSPTPTPFPSPQPTQIKADTASPDTTVPKEPTPAPTPIPPTPTIRPLPRRVVLEGVGNIRQTFNNCGPANLTQVLNFYGDDITQEEARLYLKPNYEDRNVSPWQIADYVNEQTSYRAIARSGGNFKQVKRFVAAGYPVVIEKGYELPQSGWWGHYLTVFGYDEDLAEMYSQDSYLGPLDGSGRVDRFEDVDPLWQQFNYTFYVVYRPEQEPEVMSLLDPQLQDDFSMWSHVSDLAQAEVDANPDDAFAWFNLGTAKTRLGALTGEVQYYQDGATAFDRALEIGLPPRMLWYQHQPYLAYLKTDRYQDVITLANVTLDTQGGRNVEETYWYKGHALLALGDIGGARQAYQFALTVNENFYPAQWSLDYVDSLGG
ncbi:MAG: C39 family peptidase [Anaerolineae bacterium]